MVGSATRGQKSCRPPGWALAAAGLAALLAASGCAPKRVVGSRPVTHEFALPEPEYKSAAGGETPPQAPPRPQPQSPGANTPAPPADFGSRAVALARQQLGKPYEWGASGPRSFDCSGLVVYVFKNLGHALPRVSREQARVGRPVPREELRPGDLVFFATSGGAINHVGIYQGREQFIHAPRRFEPVQVQSLDDPWWSRRFRLARRLG